MIIAGNCEEMVFESNQACELDDDLRFGILVKVKPAHRRHKWAGPTM